MTTVPSQFARQYFHGTRADLDLGDEIVVGHRSNFRPEKPLAWVYFTGTLDAAVWGAELSLGEGTGRIYVVEPTGAFEDDPNLTDMKFPGNPTQSYRSRDPLRIVGEVTKWRGHSEEQIAQMKAGLARSIAAGTATIID